MKADFNFDLLFGEQSAINIEDSGIFRKAALLYDFQPDTDFPGYSKTDIELLKSKAMQTDNINYKLLSDPELFYLLKIAEILPDRINSEIVKSEIQHRYFFSSFYKITENFAGRESELKHVSDYVDWLPKKSIMDQAIEFIRITISWYDKPPLLIQGIGGIGKSTLISKFILEHNNEKNGSKLPFIYIDFDLPGFTITEPLSILLESLRQLSIQFSAQNNIFNEISHIVSEMIYNRKQADQYAFKSSNWSSRGLVYDSVEGLISKYGWQLDKINTPVLIVFDSFEEMQYRASRSELDSFFRFIKEISEKIPRIRPVFVGRSEISEALGDFKFDEVTLSDFDYESAVVLLQKFGIADQNICKTIYDNFGGNPLLLHLAADLVKKDIKAINDFKQIKDKKHEFLINRILYQIHDPDVRKIAVPGMLVRRINSEVIQNILTIPCGLGEIDISRAKNIFNKLHKEVALIAKSYETDDIVFRQDVRMACERMIWDKYPDASAQIRQRAIDFYSIKKSKDEAAEAEYYYHLLKKGEIPEDLTRQVYFRIRTKLESSLIELPEEAKLYINTLMSSQASKTAVKNSSVIEWEQYYLSQIKKGLNSELGYLKRLYDEISSRSERSEDPNSAFVVFEALLYQRLNKLNKSNDVIDRRRRLSVKGGLIDNQYFEFGFLMAQNFEYMGKYKEALSYCETTLKGRATLPNEFLSMKYSFLMKRLGRRCGAKETLNKMEFQHHKPGFDETFADTNWNFIFNQLGDSEFMSSKEFDAVYKKYKNMLPTMKELDRFCWINNQANLKDLALSGEFEIVLRDFLYAMELKGGLEEKLNRNIYK
jgi:hypothetical protein